MHTSVNTWLLAAASALVALLTGCSPAAGAGGEVLRISGSTTVNPIASDAADVLRRDGLVVTVDTQGGSAGGIQQLAAGQVDIAMSSKPVDDSDRVAHPGTDFEAVRIGQDAVGVVVRREVVDGGLDDITRDQLRRLFEGDVRNWKQLGGPDLPTFVYDKEAGRGTREVLDKFLYADGMTPPPPPTDNPRYAVVGGNEETRSKLLSTPGSVAPLSSGYVSGFPQLAMLTVEGVAPTARTIGDGSYPLSRPLYLITDGPPAGGARRFIEYVLSEPGQQLLTEHGYLSLAELR